MKLIELALRFLEPRERLLFRHPFNMAEGITLASSLNQADLSIENLSQTLVARDRRYFGRSLR